MSTQKFKRPQSQDVEAVRDLSSKNHIVIPQEAPQAMGVKCGDELLVVVKDTLMLVLSKSKRYARRL